jgi:tRNA nucleotidyltransferase (CCA-adding enzyme)
LDDIYIEREYLKGKSTYQLAEELKCSPCTIANHLKSKGHKLRGSRKYSFNESFFEKIDTPEQAWVLGWIYSNGHLKGKDRKEIKIKLKKEDSYILNNFIKLLNYNPVLKIKKDGAIAICSKKMVQDLNNLGIPCGKKSHIIKPPKLSNELLSAFWQGVFEGDGYIGINNNSLIIGLSGNFYTCKGFKEYMGWKENKVSEHGQNSYSITKSFSNINDVQINKIYNIKLLKQKFFLKRKYHILQKWQTKVFFKNILKEIKPSKGERTKLIKIYHKIGKELEKYNKQYDFDIELNGSVAKGTSLSGNSDLDIFIKFPTNFSQKKIKTEISPLIFDILRQLGANPYYNYASHIYTKGKLDGIEIDVVPCYDVPMGEIKSAVDRTPYHTKFIKENLQEHQKDEVRLLKQFLKAFELYGANEKYQGFSGYLCELLIYVYGSFLNVLKKELTLFRSENDSHIPIVLLDPTDIKRNVAAALSWQKFNEFILISRKFLRDYENESGESMLDAYFDIPEEELFTKEDVAFAVERRGTKVYWIEYQSDSNNEEVLYSTARKRLRKLVQRIEQHDFEVFESDFQVDGRKIIFILEFEYDKLSKYKKVKGPSIDIPKEAFLNWVDSHDEIFIDSKNFYTHVERKYTDVMDILREHYLSIEKFI